MGWTMTFAPTNPPFSLGKAGLPTRIAAIDLTRGLAIALMLIANTAGELLVQPHPFWQRVLHSLAAPWFMVLMGVMLGSTLGQRPMRYYLKRSMGLLGLAAAIDALLWRHLPFISYDILYVAGFSTLVLGALGRLLPLGWQRALLWLMAIGAIGLASLLRQWLGYPEHVVVSDIPAFIAGSFTLAEAISFGFWQGLLWGWFPLLPWLGLVAAGGLWGHYRNLAQPLTGMLMGILKLVTLVALLLWWLWPGPAYVRGGFSELFYPPVVTFCLAGLASTFAITELGYRLLAFSWLRGLLAPFLLVGQHALFAYVTHLVLIQLVQLALQRLPFAPEKLPAPLFWLLVIGLAIGLLAVTAFWHHVKMRKLTQKS